MTLGLFDPWFLRIVAVLLGLVWGSFLNVVIYRVPRDMSVVRPPSHCPACGKHIPFFRNVPLFGYLLLRGRAGCCGAKIPWRYPLVEAIGGILSLAIVEVIVLDLPSSTPLLRALAIYFSDFGLAMSLCAAAFIDLEHMFLPDPITLGGTVLGLATFSLRGMSAFEAFLGAAIGFAVVWLPFIVIYPRIRGREGMGLGDAKLLMLAGAWFGYAGALVVLGFGAVQGALTAIVLMSRGKLDEPEAVKTERERILAELETLSEDERARALRELQHDPIFADRDGVGQMPIPFGPFLVLAILEYLLLGERFMRALLA